MHDYLLVLLSNHSVFPQNMVSPDICVVLIYAIMAGSIEPSITPMHEINYYKENMLALPV